MGTVKIKLRKSKGTDRVGTLYFLVVHHSRSAQITTEYRILPELWDEESQTIRTPDSFVGNDSFEQIRYQLNGDLAMIKSLIGSFDHLGVRYTASDVVKAFRNYFFGYTFLTFMDKQIGFLRENDQLGTSRTYQRTRNSFSNFLEDSERLFSTFDEHLVSDYELWLKKRNLLRNTTSFYMRVLSAVYNRAVEEEMVEQDHPFKKVYTGVDHTRKRAVDETVLVRLRTLKLHKNSAMYYARDLFLFSFYARGMSFVDMAYFKKSDVRNGVMTYVRQKTKQLMTVRVEPCMKSILDRYAKKTKHMPYCFPIITEKKEDEAYAQYLNKLSYYNKQLKLLSKQLEIKTPLSSYTSRHTWATLAQDKNVPIAVISSCMGHSSQATTQIYLASLKSSVVDEANRTVISQ